MKVLHIVIWYSLRQDTKLFAGVFHNELAKALQKECETAIWFPYDDSIDDELLMGVEWGVLTFRSNISSKKMLQLIKCKKQFKTILQSFNPDLIHAHVGRRAGFLAVYLGKHFNIPVVISEHEPLELMELNKWKNRYRQKYAYKHSDANLCVSDYLKSELNALYPEIQFTTVYNGVIDPFSYLSESNQSYYVDNSINAVIVSGFYNKDIKGYQYLLPALKKVNSKRKEKVFLHICGDGEFLEYYKNLANRIGISESCRFYGHCDKGKVFQIVNQMDFGISSSLFESAGVSIEEMLLLGKPVVVTKSGGGNSLVSKENAIIVDKGSVEALAIGIDKMANSFQTYDNAVIRKKAIRMFEMNSIVKKHIEIYKNVTSNSN